MPRLFVCNALLFLSALASTAQQAAPSGTVAGTITFGDTRKPARFAKVMLSPVHSDVGKSLEGMDKKEAAANPMAALGALMGAVTMLSTQTDVEGHYQLTGVPPGDYFVLANVPGYISPSMEDMQSKELPGTVQTHVEGNQTVRADLALERGAVITGTVLFEDGSPVTAAPITVELAKKPEKPAKGDNDMDIGRGMMLAMSGGLKVVATDDLGHFRIAGLAPGEYHVSAQVTMGNTLSMKGGVMDLSAIKGGAKRTVYAPGTLHEGSARTVVARAGQEADGADIAVNLSATHSVAGRVSSAVDHHPLNSGSVSLEDTTDAKVNYTASVGADGTFTLLYVPTGTYTLKVSDGADTEPSAKKRPTGLLNFQQDKVLKSYEDASQPQMVGEADVIGVQVELKESAKVKKQPDLNGIFGSGGKTE